MICVLIKLSQTWRNLELLIVGLQSAVLPSCSVNGAALSYVITSTWSDDDVTQAKWNNPTVNKGHVFLSRRAIWLDAALQFLFQSHRLETSTTHLLSRPCLRLCDFERPYFIFIELQSWNCSLFQLSVWRGSINNYVRRLNRPIEHAASREEMEGKRWLIPPQCQFSHSI